MAKPAGLLLLLSTLWICPAEAKTTYMDLGGTVWQLDGFEKVGKERFETTYTLRFLTDGTFRLSGFGTPLHGSWTQKKGKATLSMSDESMRAVEDCCLFVEGIVPEIRKWTFKATVKVKNGVASMKASYALSGLANYFFLKVKRFSRSFKGTGAISG